MNGQSSVDAGIPRETPLLLLQQQQRQQQQPEPSTRRVFSIPLEASSERRQSALLGQLRHHRNRRLARNEHRRRLQQLQEQQQPRSSGLRGEQQQQHISYGEPRQHHPGSWRESYEGSSIIAGIDDGDDNNNNNNNDDHSHRRRDLMDGLITSVALSNCHLVLYSGEITLGSPPNLQHFRVDFDTAGSDLWIPSKLCDETCTSDHPMWNLYDPSVSPTYEVATSDPNRNNFALEYQDGEAIRGQHAKDTLRLGDDGIRIPHQVFAHVTHIQNFATCEEEEGILGLANAMQTTHGFPSLLGNVLRRSQQAGGSDVLPYNMFGMYLRSDIDDYEGIDVNNPLEKPRQSSELILGGVNSEHYQGCLNWHDLVQQGSSTLGTSDEGISDFQKYWSVRMDDIKVGGTSLKDAASPTTGELLAVLDSGSSYIVGPQAPVARLVQMNQAKCFRMDSGGAESSADPKEVDCNDPAGFDGAVLSNCDSPFFSVEFVIDGVLYNLEKDDLMVHLDTLFGTVCIMRIVASQGMNGWILGDAFLNKYYTAFDFENQKLGLAPAAEFADDRCERDIDMDVNNFWKNDNDDIDGDVFAPDEYQPDLPGGMTPEIGDAPASSGGGGATLDDDFFTSNYDDDAPVSNVGNFEDDDDANFPENPPPPTDPPQAPPTDAPTTGAPSAAPTLMLIGTGSTDKNLYNDDDTVNDVTDYTDDVTDPVKDYTDDVTDPVKDYTDDDNTKEVTDYTDDVADPVKEYSDDDNNAGDYVETNSNRYDDDVEIGSTTVENPEDDDFAGVTPDGGGNGNADTYSDDQPISDFDPADTSISDFDPDFDPTDTSGDVGKLYDDDNDNVNDNVGGSGNDVLYDDDNGDFLTIAQFDDGPVPESPPVFSPVGGGGDEHHEGPERASVWKGFGSGGGRAPGTEREDMSFIGIAGIVLVLATLVPVAAFLLHRRRRRARGDSKFPTKQDEAFDKTYKRAEKKMLREHRNLNYRNHAGQSPRSIDAIDIALDELSYVDEEFRDEEGAATSASSTANGGADHHHRNGGVDGGRHGGMPNGDDDETDGFVLDANLLQRMN